MENERGLTIVLWIIALVGMFFLARGMTGNVIMNSYSLSDSCSSDKECSAGKICCFYSGNGVCSDHSMCQELNGNVKETPQMNRGYLFDIGFGLLILIAVLIAFYSVNRRNRFSKSVSKRNTKRSKKRRR